ncbi:transglutaminase-like cysteine peptidase [Pseudodesulfovibrio sp.]|uniref:transglutaminase-like cysteine peptidase n=1 Tax=Pseudodesulfovibrio sp. TaxID=2035812 RepID=UPI0026246BF3|nr:transglutaminase-like cysteine peptidase [Pseudodesulfovibrio sp.]MDD3311178.1 transglutaminase-like cysteine peptidase [Pseudodesulfovibrio sp.]
MARAASIHQAVTGAFCALLLALCLARGASAGAPAPPADGKSAGPRLFGTVEFKGNLEKLPKWTGVLKKMAIWKGYFNSPDMAKLPSRNAWVKLKAELADKPEMDKLKGVNKFFNQWPYRLDAANYGESDYWASPQEFIKKSGDCEDYAIAKYYALKELGFSEERMRIVAVRDMIRNIGHAILAVYLPDNIYILDNQTVMVLPDVRYKHYMPQYSVNEKFRWMHVPVSKNTAFQRAKKQ